MLLPTTMLSGLIIAILSGSRDSICIDDQNEGVVRVSETLTYDLDL